MAAAHDTNSNGPLPRYLMPDTSVPQYDEIMEHIQNYPRSCIGISYYYIRAERNEASLCRIVPGGGRIFFHEVVDHEKHGISGDEIDQVVTRQAPVVPGYYPISPSIENKLKVLFEHRHV